MTSFFEHQRSSFKRNYLKNLIALASGDGNLAESEKELILKIGIKRGLKEWQISEMLEDTCAHQVFIPESVSNRMNLLYDVMQLIFADGHVSESEHSFIVNILALFKLKAELIHQLLELFKVGTPSSAEWAEFVEVVISNPHVSESTIL